MDRPRPLKMRAIALVLAFGGALATSCKEPPPPLSEALVVVDTDAPVPGLAGRLRIDFYDDASTWYESRDVATPDPSAWPVSFSVYTPDEVGARSVVLRLRAYPEGKTRDYRGERFQPRGEEEPRPISKRLVGPTGTDMTPPFEPQPLLTMDRLVRVALVPGQVGSARIVLRGACFGTMADLATGASCVDTEDVRVPLATVTLDPDMTLSDKTQQGSFGKTEPCAGAPGVDEVCVPGGAFIFGNAAEYGVGDGDGVPERVARVSPFYIDRYEHTVARWRAAYETDKLRVARGVTLNEGRIVSTTIDPIDDRLCTASDAPRGRETFALTCVDWNAARALCRRGGSERDLPTEVQWEYAAQFAGRSVKTRFPWGNEAISCDRAVYGRFVRSPLTVCDGLGPLPVYASEHAEGDVSPLGIVGLAGGVSEILRDAAFRLDADCWRRAGLLDAICPPEAGRTRSMRGGGWATEAEGGPQMRPQLDRADSYSGAVGFRCARSAGNGSAR